MSSTQSVYSDSKSIYIVTTESSPESSIVVGLISSTVFELCSSSADSSLQFLSELIFTLPSDQQKVGPSCHSVIFRGRLLKSSKYTLPFANTREELLRFATTRFGPQSYERFQKWFSQRPSRGLQYPEDAMLSVIEQRLAELRRARRRITSDVFKSPETFANNSKLEEVLEACDNWVKRTLDLCTNASVIPVLLNASTSGQDNVMKHSHNKNGTNTEDVHNVEQSSSAAERRKKAKAQSKKERRRRNREARTVEASIAGSVGANEEMTSVGSDPAGVTDLAENAMDSESEIDDPTASSPLTLLNTRSLDELDQKDLDSFTEITTRQASALGEGLSREFQPSYTRCGNTYPQLLAIKDRRDQEIGQDVHESIWYDTTKNGIGRIGTKRWRRYVDRSMLDQSETSAQVQLKDSDAV